MKDLAGQRFGRLVAIEPTDKRLRGSVVWRCRCDCGTFCEVPTLSLTSGRKTSCGCARRGTASSNARDISGKRFGKLVAVEPTGGRHRGSVVWRCRCDCGRECDAPLSALTSGHKRSCGCVLGDGHSVKLDLAGKRFGRLVAVRSTSERRHGSVVWECACDCGNSCEATASQLVAGRKRSCGCLRGMPKGQARAADSTAFDERDGDAASCGREAFGTFNMSDASDVPLNVKDLRGERFGDLTPVRVVGRQGTHAVWECVCDCGNTCEVSSGNLASGRTSSCGCRKRGRDPRNLTARRFGKLIAVEITDEVVATGAPTGAASASTSASTGAGDAAGGGDVAGTSPVWRCLCDCDRVVRASARDLALGIIISCGRCDA